METKQATSDKTSDKSKRLIYADDLKSNIADLEAVGGNRYYRAGFNDALHNLLPDVIDEQPTVDAVPVVRCGECTHWVYTGEGRGDCTNRRFHLDDQVDPTMAHDEYCALGERRADG